MPLKCLELQLKLEYPILDLFTLQIQLQAFHRACVHQSAAKYCFIEFHWICYHIICLFVWKNYFLNFLNCKINVVVSYQLLEYRGFWQKDWKRRVKKMKEFSFSLIFIKHSTQTCLCNFSSDDEHKGKQSKICQTLIGIVLSLHELVQTAFTPGACADLITKVLLLLWL